MRVWDLFLLLGDTVLLAMAYNILKLHWKTIMKMDMELILEFFQTTLPNNFGFDDDFVIESLRESLIEMEELANILQMEIEQNLKEISFVTTQSRSQENVILEESALDSKSSIKSIEDKLEDEETAECSSIQESTVSSMNISEDDIVLIGTML